MNYGFLQFACARARLHSELYENRKGRMQIENYNDLFIFICFAALVIEFPALFSWI